MEWIHEIAVRIGAVLGPYSAIIEVLNFAAVVFFALIAWVTVRQVRKLQRVGKFFNNVKFQFHVHMLSGAGIVLGIRDLLKTTLQDVVVGDVMAERVVTAIARHRADTTIFRMQNADDQALFYRDIVGRAGQLLPADAVPHVLVVFCEKGPSVSRQMLRPVLLTQAQLADYCDLSRSIESPVGKEVEAPRIVASREIGLALRGVVLSEIDPAYFDTRGFVIAHLVSPATANIKRVA